jgi:hypothetical protein
MYGGRRESGGKDRQMERGREREREDSKSDEDASSGRQTFLSPLV